MRATAAGMGAATAEAVSDVMTATDALQHSFLSCGNGKATSAAVGPPPYPPGYFDYVLLDPPCSALGLRPRLLHHWSLKQVRCGGRSVSSGNPPSIHHPKPCQPFLLQTSIPILHSNTVRAFFNYNQCLFVLRYLSFLFALSSVSSELHLAGFQAVRCSIVFDMLRHGPHEWEWAPESTARDVGKPHPCISFGPPLLSSSEPWLRTRGPCCTVPFNYWRLAVRWCTAHVRSIQTRTRQMWHGR